MENNEFIVNISKMQQKKSLYRYYGTACNDLASDEVCSCVRAKIASCYFSCLDSQQDISASHI